MTLRWGEADVQVCSTDALGPHPDSLTSRREASCDHCQEVTVAGRTVSVSGDPTATVSISSIHSIALGRDPTRENRSWVALLSLSPDEGQMLRRMFDVLDEVLVAVDGAPHFVVPGADVGPSVVVRGNEKEVTQFAAAIRVPARILPTVDPEAVRAAARRSRIAERRRRAVRGAFSALRAAWARRLGRSPRVGREP